MAGISCPPRTQHVKVGEDVFDGVPRYTRKICETKINYLPNNPGKAGWVSRPEHGTYSSTAFYFAREAVKSMLLHDMEIM